MSECFKNKEVKKMDNNIELTEQEKTVILNIAKRKGCDRDGDVIQFIVKEDMNIVEVV
jgi:hypothetical protein